MGAALILAALTLTSVGQVRAADGGVILVAKIERAAPVDFEEQVLPILRHNCLACHNQTRAKAGLVLETPETILKGSDDGPVVVPGRSAESLLLKVASHQSKPTMPPRDNKVNAADLTEEELGLLKLWIDQGTKGEVHGGGTIEWQPLPESFEPIYAVAVSPDGQLAVCNRANRLFVYHLPTKRLLACLEDPKLAKTRAGGRPGIAHLDAVRALAFSPDGGLLASGGYREVKLWRRPKDTELLKTTGWSNGVAAMALSPNANWLALVDGAGQVHVRRLGEPTGDGATMERVLTVGAEAMAKATILKFSPDGSRLAAGGRDGRLLLWDVDKRELLARGKVDGIVTALEWLGDASRLAAGNAKGLISVWRISGERGGEITRVKELAAGNEAVNALEGIPGRPEELASAEADGLLRIWNVEKSQIVREMKHGAPIVALSVSPDGKRLVTAGTDHAATLWSAENGKEIARLKGERYAQERVAADERALHFATHELAYCKKAFSDAEKQRQEQVQRVRNAAEQVAVNEKTVTEKKKALDESTAAEAVAQKVIADLDGRLAKAKATSDQGQKAAQRAARELKERFEALAQLGEAAGKSEVKGLEDEDAAAQELRRAEEEIDQLQARASAAGHAKAELEALTEQVKQQQKEANEKLASAKKRVQAAETDFKKAEQARSNSDNELSLAIAAAHRAAESATQAEAAIPLAEGEVKHLEAEGEAARKAAVEAEAPLRAVEFSPDNSVVATAGEDRLVHTWSAETGKAIETLRGAEAPVQLLAFRDAKNLVAADADGASVGWCLNPAWTLERVLGAGDASSSISDRVNALDFSPDGRTLAVGSGEPSRSGQIELWNVGAGQMAQEFGTVHSDAVLALAFSPNGKYLASGAADRFMRVLDLSAGKVLRSFEGHTHHVLGVAWKRDGRTLATAGADDMVKIWDFSTGERKKTVEGFSKEVTSVVRFMDDQFLVSSGDQQVRVINEKDETIRSFKGAGDFVYAAAATPDGTMVVAGGQDGVLCLWDGRTGEAVTRFDPGIATLTNY
jgi:WD40 repeat protein